MAILTYLQVHVYYNLPPLILSYLLYRPLSTKGDIRKYLFLVVISVLYTTPWDNYIILRKAWWYCPQCVMGTIGYVPVEEYVFFITQTLLTSLIHSLFVRRFCGLPAVGIRSHKGFPWKSSAVVCILVAMMASWWITEYDNPKSFYMRAITMWTTPVLLFLFAVTGLTKDFLSGRILVSIASVLVPTLYLWLIDSIAICAGTWHINERLSLEIFIWRGLPIEEAVFFLVTNTMVVLGCTGFDLAFTIIHTYEQKADFSFASLCWALLKARDEQVVDDLRSCVELLKRSSSSFYSSSFFFNEAVRRDLVVLYAFCRYTDNIADDTGEEVMTRRGKLDQVRSLIEEHFPPRNATSFQPRSDDTIIKGLSNPIHRSMLRFLSHKIPREPLLELLDGYDWDLELDNSSSRQIRFEEDLISYSNHVASSVAECCVHVLQRDPDTAVVSSAREMGVVLQLTNVARDILTDALHGRVYVPSQWFEDDERIQLLDLLHLPHHNIEVHPDARKLLLERHALRLLDIADKSHKRSTNAIASLPIDAQIGIKIATDGYFAIGQALAVQCQDHYPLRARLTQLQRSKLVIARLYKPSRTDMLLGGACVMRVILILYGQWQDALDSNVKFTDIDYQVFSDAARFVQAGGSPYDRATYRYTPLLAWILIPNQYYTEWGKIIFAAGDVLAGWFLMKLLARRKLSVWWSALWLLNPMVAVISSRGNCEGLLGALATALIYSLENRRISLAGVVLGIAIHFKIYPIIYAPSVFWALDTNSQNQNRFLSYLRFFNWDRIKFASFSATTFLILSAFMFHMYGADFIEHTFLYHISRSDHRHNFSPYHLFLYLSSSPVTELGNFRYASLLAFAPQFLLCFVLLPLVLAKRDLVTCLFAQTFAFVTFNKVVTSQYFMWYLVFLPLYLPQSILVSRRGALLLFLWIISQALWLYEAYGFEMLGHNTFKEMWVATLLFFAVNVFILGDIISSPKVVVRGTAVRSAPTCL